MTNWGKLVLQIGVTLFYYKLGQTLLHTGGSYYKLGKGYYKIRQLLQIRTKFITNWDRYYKLGQLLQIGA